MVLFERDIIMEKLKQEAMYNFAIYKLEFDKMLNQNILIYIQINGNIGNRFPI